MTDAAYAEAIRAREAGDHAAACDLWRALLRRHPGDWRVALELKRDLKAGWHYPESDPQFRRAAASLPDAEWLAHYAALYAYHGEDLDILDRRARALLATRPDDPALLTILGDVAAQRRDWPTAQSAYAKAGETHKRDTAALYHRLSEPSPAGGRGQGEGGWSSQRQRYAIRYLNLDRNPERAAELGRQFAASAPPLHRSAGVEGRRLPAAAIRRLGADPDMRGTLGCFLSHAGAWEAALNQPEPFTLVIEDDVIPLLDLPTTLDAFNLPDAFDIVFVNDRLSPRLDPAATTGFTTRPLDAAMRAFHPDDNAPGGDGYILSRAGAAKLLDWVAADGFADDVDWRLIAYGLTPAAVAALPRPSHAGPWLDRISQLIRRPDRLDAHVLHPPLIRTVGVSSDREDENRISSQSSVISRHDILASTNLMTDD